MEEPLSVKKESLNSDFEDALRTLASAALEHDSVSVKEESKLVQIRDTIKSEDTYPSSQVASEPIWFDVGIINSTSSSVDTYYDTGASIDHSMTNSDNLPDYSRFNKLPLVPGTAYKFRVAAVNSYGIGQWSDVSAFKTCLPGFPSAPCSIKITKTPDGANLQWEEPVLVFGKIIEYSVCLAVNKCGDSDVSTKDLQFMRVYSGTENHAFIDHMLLKAAFIDKISKPAIIFRIAARNEKGYGPATQVRWLQEMPHILNKNRK